MCQLRSVELEVTDRTYTAAQLHHKGDKLASLSIDKLQLKLAAPNQHCIGREVSALCVRFATKLLSKATQEYIARSAQKSLHPRPETRTPVAGLSAGCLALYSFVALLRVLQSALAKHSSVSSA